MSEQQTTEPQPEAPDQKPDTEQKQEPDYKAETEKWKALARKHEEKAKANAEAAKRLDEIEESQKSEIEKAVARAEKAETELATLRAESIRAEVALAKGLTPAQAKRLIGSTRQELEADADELLEALGMQKKSNNISPREGNNPRPQADSKRTFLRELTGQG